MHVLCKALKAIVNICLIFRPIYSALGIPTHKIAKFLVPILNCIAINEFTIKEDSFSFAKVIVEQDSSLYMSSLDVDLLLINISLKETITICAELIYNQNDTAEYLSKSESLYKQIDSVAMDSPLGLTFVLMNLNQFIIEDI